jgi:hypothetical protein
MQKVGFWTKVEGTGWILGRGLGEVSKFQSFKVSEFQGFKVSRSQTSRVQA